MANKKTGMTNPKDQQQGDLTGVLIKMIAFGVAGGAFLIAGAKLLGEKILEIELDKYEKLERQHREGLEEAKRIAEAEDYEHAAGLLTSSEEQEVE